MKFGLYFVDTNAWLRLPETGAICWWESYDYVEKLAQYWRHNDHNVIVREIPQLGETPQPDAGSLSTE